MLFSRNLKFTVYWKLRWKINCINAHVIKYWCTNISMFILKGYSLNTKQPFDDRFIRGLNLHGKNSPKNEID